METLACESPILEKCSSNVSTQNRNDTLANFQSCFQEFQNNCSFIGKNAGNFWKIISFLLFGILIVMIGLAGFYIHNRYTSSIHFKLFGSKGGRNATGSSLNLNYKIPENPDLKLYQLENKLADKKYLLKNYNLFKETNRLPKNVASIKELKVEIEKLQRKVDYEKYLRNNEMWDKEYSNMNLENLIKERKTIENQIKFYKLYYYRTPGKDLRSKGELQSRAYAIDKEIFKHHQRNLSQSKIDTRASLESIVDSKNELEIKLSDLIMENKDSDIIKLIHS